MSGLRDAEDAAQTAPEPLVFEPAECDEDRRLRYRPFHTLLERDHERHAVGLAALAQHRQQHVQLEVLERLFSHCLAPSRTLTNSVSRIVCQSG